MDYDPVEFGKLQGKVDALETQVLEMRSDLKELLALANKGRGAWWIALTLVSVLSSGLSWGVTSLFK